MLSFSIIIISYNTKEYTLECLLSVYEQTQSISYEVIVVDNASADGSAEAIEQQYPAVKLIRSQENLGFARANNVAAEQARGEYLLLLNPDTLILDGAIQKLHQFAIEHPNNLIYGGRTLYSDLSLNPTSCWRKPTLWSLFCYATGLVSIFRRNAFLDPESYGAWPRDTVRAVDIVTGCFLLIKKSFWDQLQGFDPEFFMYGEDADLCLRGKQHGAKPIITPAATIIHHGGVSEKIRADKMIRLFRAKEQLIRRHWSNRTQPLGIFLLRLSVFSRMLASNALKYCGLTRFQENAACWGKIWKRRKTR